MAPRDPRPVHVTGGTHGITADCAEILAVAGRFGAAARETLSAALVLHGYLVSPTLIASALLDPPGYARFEADLAAALDGPRGLSWAGAACGAIDGELRLAAAAYRRADSVAEAAHDSLVGVIDAPSALLAGAALLARTGNPVRAAQEVVARDPAMADDLVDLLQVPRLLDTIAGGIPDGHGVVRGAGVDRAGVAGRPPRNLAEVLTDLARRNGDQRHGAIDVRLLTLADGARRAIVDITGTKSWTPLPTNDVTSLTTNGRAVVGRPTAYEGGVLAAMRAAGVRSTDKVMLVGHSEGGMVAVTAARDAVASGAFDITHVVTAGSPVGLTAGALPAGVQLLALENSQDVVPHLDGRRNPDRTNVTTVTGTRGDGTVVGDHDIAGAYVPLAADAQASGDPSVRDFLSSADGYFQGISVETHTYQIQRKY